MVDTVIGGINHVEEGQSGKAVTISEGFDALDAMAGMAQRGNRITNSGLLSWQEGVSFAAIADLTWFADLFQWKDTSAGIATVARSTDVPDGDSPFSMFVDVTTIDASIAAGDLIGLQHKVEGVDIRDALLGVAGARTLHLTFDVKSNKTGIYCVSFANDAEDRSFVVEYTVLSADTWETKVIALTGDLAGTWLDGLAVVGLKVRWALVAGTNFQGVADTWNAANDLATANQINFFDNAANEWRMANPRLYVGTLPSNATGHRVGEREHALELERIKRYFERLDGGVVSGSVYATGQAFSTTDADVPITYTQKAKVPTITVSAAADFDLTIAAGTITPVTGLTPSASTVKGAIMNATVGAVLVAGHATLLKDDTTAASFIDVDARL